MWTRRALGSIDSLNGWVGSAARWLTVALILTTVTEVVARYVLGNPTVWAYDTSMMLGGSIIVLGWGYNHLNDSHIRVEVLYTRLSVRRRAAVDAAGAFLFLPVCGALAATSISKMLIAWRTGEVMTGTFWYPPAGPFRTVIAFGLCLMCLQFLAQFIRSLATLAKGKALS